MLDISASQFNKTGCVEKCKITDTTVSDLLTFFQKPEVLYDSIWKIDAISIKKEFIHSMKVPIFQY